MRVAVCQLNARDDRAANLAAAEALLVGAAEAGADLALLPEYVDYLGPADRMPPAEPVDGEVGRFFAATARRLGLWVIAGSFHEAGPDPAHTWNTSLVFDREGALAAAYRKIHLYDVEIPGRVSYQESATVAPGEKPVVVDVEGLRVGLSICYDLRFPELYRQLAVDGGAELLVVPAAFMMHTGRDHWEVLLRARAIENQCFVAAAGQTGDHDPGRTCFGRSMVVDPWGTVVSQVPDGPGLTVAEIDLDRLRTIRAELPSLANRRL
ncbi:carbon-nitrogen hydrolase family protein [Micromonospora schwarzwaldensis]|uniref:carbon-nitrogen hydrolase family protein n=1 Tax=Micromonospora sp. DSM 45708 TaxID=3111767 RepID=UPI0031E0BF1C